MARAGRCIPAYAALFVLGLALTLSADRAWVANRGGTVVNFFDTATNTEEAGSPIAVGSGPVAIASDQPSGTGPTRLFVVNSGSHSVTAIDVTSKTAFAAITGSEGGLGALDLAQGIVRVHGAGVHPSIVVTDQKVTSGPGGTGRSTIRWIDPASLAVVDEFREANPEARYNDVVWTSNGRLWIADDGDYLPGSKGGITVVRISPAVAGPPFVMAKTLIFNGAGEYADWITDPAPAPTYLINPRRLATNGTTRVVAVDGSSDVVTILDADYPGDSEAVAILRNADLGLSAGVFANDVEVVGDFAYVTTTSSSAGMAKLLQIDLVTYAVTSNADLAAGTLEVAGLGATSDGLKLYVGAAAAGSGAIRQIDIDPPSDFPGSAAVVAGPFPGGNIPFAFLSSPVNPSTDPGPGAFSQFSSENEVCGLLGLEVLALVGLALFLRKS